MQRAETLHPAHGGLTMGERIALQRKRLALSRETLAASAGISSKSVGRYERDESEPQATELGRLALALETTADYLVGLRDDPIVPEDDSATRVWLKPAG